MLGLLVWAIVAHELGKVKRREPHLVVLAAAAQDIVKVKLAHLVAVVAVSSFLGLNEQELFRKCT